MKRIALLLALGFGLPSAASAQSANSFITYLGLDWAWASPCASGIGDSCANDVNLVNGWRYATAIEWANRPSTDDFLDAGGNFFGSGGQMRCASDFFGSGRDHCDFDDPTYEDGYVMSGPGIGLQHYLSETWLVRDLNGPPGDTVPEPATMFLVATGLAGIAAKRRRS